MAERPPPGYNIRDKPLAHKFAYKFGLGVNVVNATSAMMTFLRTSKNSVDPKTIEVNNRNTSFAKDAGPLICFDSIVQMISISLAVTMTKACIVTDKLEAVKVYHQNIHGAFEDAWTPADEISTTTIADILNVTSDTVNEDVTPEFQGTTLPAEEDHPLSTVTAAEVFGDYNLTTNAQMENTEKFDIDEYFDALQFYTNGGKLKSLTGPLQSFVLTRNHTIQRIFQQKFTPKSVRFGNPHMFFAKRITTPVYNSVQQLTSNADAPTAIAEVMVTCNVRFNEWNPDFDQARM